MLKEFEAINIKLLHSQLEKLQEFQADLDLFIKQNFNSKEPNKWMVLQCKPSISTETLKLTKNIFEKVGAQVNIITLNKNTRILRMKFSNFEKEVEKHINILSTACQT